MKILLRFSTVIFLTLGSTKIYSQTPTPFFSAYGNTHHSNGTFIHALSNTDIIVFGLAVNPALGNGDILGMRLTSSGVPVWDHYYGTADFEHVSGCDVSPGEDIYVLTTSYLDNNVKVLKIDVN